MNINKLIICFSLCLFNLVGYGQIKDTLPDTNRKNIIYLSVLGDAINLGINYERLIPTMNHNFIAMKIGAGYASDICILCTTNEYFALSQNITHNIGSKNRKFEYGLGITQLFGEKNITYIYPTIGFRYLASKPSKVTFRIAVQTPIVKIHDDSDHFFVPVGIFIGRQF